MQRPLRSQSPKRVGSGPVGPPISRGRAAAAAATVVATGSGACGASIASAGNSWVACMDVRKSARIHPNRPRKLRKNIIMRTEWRVITALDFGVLRARGPDAISFLQGQLSNDATRVQRGQWQLSGYHTPQGRAIALLRLTLLAPDDVLAVLPLELVPVVVTRLKRFVLRAKVQITDDTAQWRIRGFHGAAPALPAGAVAAAYGRSRHLVLLPGALEVDAASVTGTR